MRYKASPSPSHSRSNRSPPGWCFSAITWLLWSTVPARPSPKEPRIKTTRPESLPLPTIASLSAWKDNDWLITQTEEKWPSKTTPASSHSRQEGSAPDFGSCRCTLIFQDAAGCRSCHILPTSARRWWSLLFGGVFVVVFFSFRFFPLLLRFQGV